MATQIGRLNTLRVVKEKEFGVYLNADELGEIYCLNDTFQKA